MSDARAPDPGDDATALEGDPPDLADATPVEDAAMATAPTVDPPSDPMPATEVAPSPPPETEPEADASADAPERAPEDPTSGDRGEAAGAGSLTVPPPGDPEATARIESILVDLAGKAEALTPDLAAGAREETVAQGFAGIQRGLDEMVRLTRRADEHVAELHADNQRLRAGELSAALQPMIRDLVRLHDEVAQLASASHPEAHQDLDLVGSRLLDTLARWGLTPFTPAAGDRLDATRHHGVGRVASSDGEPGTVATVRRPGFAHDDGRTFRAAEVEVFQAPPPPPTPDDPPATGQTEET